MLILITVGVVLAFAAGFLIGRARRQREAAAVPWPAAPTAVVAPARGDDVAPSPSLPAPVAPAMVAAPAPRPGPAADAAVDERARIIRSYEAEAAALRTRLAASEAAIAPARAEATRYRQLVVDLENNAPSLLLGPGAPDDLKLIVGVGPVLERMLHQLGVGTYRQIAHWSERDIDEFDAKLPEFPGRIRRDGWVTQAWSLHQSKYGESLPVRGG